MPQSAILSDDLDLPHDVLVEVVKVLGWHPVLKDRSTADLVYLIPIHERLPDLKPGHVAHAACLDIPVARDLGRVVLVENWVEDGLLG
jgi:hypothetical protein